MKINYPDCTTFEGNKVLMFNNVSIDDILLQKDIDPHFSSSVKYIHPFARFEPTVHGWKIACIVAQII